MIALFKKSLDMADPQRRRRRLTLATKLACGAAAVMVTASFAFGLWTKPVAPAAPLTAAAASIVGLGYIEPSSRLLTIDAPTNSEASRIAELKVAEGQNVGKGDVLAVLDTATRLAAQVAGARAQVALKEVQLERQRLESAYSKETRRFSLDRAQAELASAKSEYQRQLSLMERSISSRSSFEKAQRDYLAATADLREAEAAMKRAQAVTASDDAGADATQIDVAVALRELESAKGDLIVAEAYLDQAVIRAPVAGVILSVRAQPGERIGTDGLLEMGSTARMRAVVEIDQSDVRRLRIGQQATLWSDALQQSIVGTLESVGGLVKRQTVVNNDPATATDARVVEVRVALDESSSNLVAGLSRLQVVARFE